MAAQAPIFPKKQPGRRTEQKSTPMPLEEQVRLLAYEIYVQRGGQPGSEIEDWLQAEAELRASAVAKLTKFR
jgi:hypothetical protein